MTPKEYLSQVAMLNHRIEIKNKQLEDARRRLLSSRGLQYDKERVQNTPRMDPVGDSVIRFRELEIRIREMTDRYIAQRDMITDQINSMNDDAFIRILSMRYIDNLKFKSIAHKMGYTEQYVIVLHGKALQAFGEQYQEYLNIQ